MPLSNHKDRTWVGWVAYNSLQPLPDDAETKIAADVQATIIRLLKAANIPKGKVTETTANMWWRPKTRAIDVESAIDGTLKATIHIQEFGTSLFIGRASELSSNDNYYKRMAYSAFVGVIDHNIVLALEELQIKTRDLSDTPPSA